MTSVTRTLYYIHIMTEFNDPVRMKEYNEPATFGYKFLIDDEFVEEDLREFIKDTIKESNQPYLGISLMEWQTSLPQNISSLEDIHEFIMQNPATPC